MVVRVWEALRVRYRRAPDRWSALIVLGLGTAMTALDLTDIWGSSPGLPDGRWWHLIPLVLGSIVILLRGRGPLRALAAGTALAVADLALGGSIAMILVFFELLYAATLRSSQAWRRRLGAGIAAVIVAGTLAAWIMSADVRFTVLLALQLFALLATPYWWGAAVGEGAERAEAEGLRAEAEASRAEAESSRARAEAGRADDMLRLGELRRAEAIGAERARMARDLHDAIAGELSAIALHSEAAMERTDPGHSAAVSLRAVREASVASLVEMRAMIHMLRGGEDRFTAPQRLAELDEIVGRFRRGGLRVEISGSAPALPVAADQALARIVQESLTNALKHSPKAPVRMSFGGDDRWVRLGVRSLGAEADAERDGPGGCDAGARSECGGPGSAGWPGTRAVSGSAGGSVTAEGGLGLIMMRERAETLGGNLRAGWDGGDWLLEASLPRRAP